MPVQQAAVLPVEPVELTGHLRTLDPTLTSLWLQVLLLEGLLLGLLLLPLLPR
jgi:hypothetical protein